MFRTSVDEGSYIPTHWHRAVGIIYLLEGKLEVTIESQTFLMQADDCTPVSYTHLDVYKRQMLFSSDSHLPSNGLPVKSLVIKKTTTNTITTDAMPRCV